VTATLVFEKRERERERGKEMKEMEGNSIVYVGE